MDQLTRKKLDIDTVRGKYRYGEQVLVVDWRLRKDHKYDVTGKLSQFCLFNYDYDML